MSLRPVFAVLAAAVVLAVAGCPPNTPDTVSVPDASNLTAAAAASLFTNAKLTLGTTTEAYSNTVAAGLVISQQPAAGAKVEPGTAVNIVVSLGTAPPGTVTVPSLANLTAAAAATALTNAKLTLGTTTQAYSNTVATGLVISQQPAAATKVDSGTAVSIVVSKGAPPAETVTVPDASNLTAAAAASLFTNAKLALGATTEAYSNTVATGRVISQQPIAGATVEAGTAVNIVVSKGTQPPGTVPAITGLDKNAAVAALTAAGFAAGEMTYQYAIGAADKVLAQNPAGGANASAGAAVSMTLSRVLPLTDGALTMTPPASNASQPYALATGVAAPAAPAELLVAVERAISAADLLALVHDLTAQGETIIGALPETRVLQVRVPAALNLAAEAARIADKPAVRGAHPNLFLRDMGAGLDAARVKSAAHMPDSFPGDYWIEAIHAPEAWSVLESVSDDCGKTKLGIVDNGIGGNVLDWARVDKLVMPGSGGVPNDTSAGDVGPAVHGSPVAAFAAGDGASGSAVDTVGMAWDNPVVFASWYTPASGAPKYVPGTLFSAMAAIERVIGEGARVVNIGCGPILDATTVAGEDAFRTLYRAYRDVMTYSVETARDADVLLVFPAGNAGYGMDAHHRPPIDFNADGDATDAGEAGTTTPAGSPNYAFGLTFRSDNWLLPDARRLDKSGRDRERAWGTHALIVGAVSSEVDIPEAFDFADTYVRRAGKNYLDVTPEILATGKLAQFSVLGDVIGVVAPGHLVSPACAMSASGAETGEGTSYAAALVTGTAGLAMGLHGNLTAPETRQYIIDLANHAPFDGLRAGCGGGLIDAGETAGQAVALRAVPAQTAPDYDLSNHATATMPVTVQVPAGGVYSIDLLFLTDVTSTYGSDIAALKAKAGELAAAVKEQIPDARFGLASFADFPIAPYGGWLEGDEAYMLHGQLRRDTDAFQSAADSLVLLYGGDDAESQYEALYQAATGAGLDIDEDDEYATPGDIPPATPGWRENALRVIVISTDAAGHDSATETDYPGKSRDEAIAALQEQGIIVIALYEGESARAALEPVVTAAGGTMAALEDNSANLVTAVMDGLDASLEKLDVSIEVLNDPDGCITIPATVQNVAPGQSLQFKITLTGPAGSPFAPITHSLMACARVNNSAVIKRIPCRVRY